MIKKEIETIEKKAKKENETYLKKYNELKTIENNLIFKMEILINYKLENIDNIYKFIIKDLIKYINYMLKNNNKFIDLNNFYDIKYRYDYKLNYTDNEKKLLNELLKKQKDYNLIYNYYYKNNMILQYYLNILLENFNIYDIDNKKDYLNLLNKSYLILFDKTFLINIYDHNKIIKI